MGQLLFRAGAWAFAITVSLLSILSPYPAASMPIRSFKEGQEAASFLPKQQRQPIDAPNPVEVIRVNERKRLQGLLSSGRLAPAQANVAQQELSELAKTGSDRVLVVLVEFGGPDTITWTKGVSTWDPYGKADAGGSTGAAYDCSKIIGETKTFTYSGPLHNRIPRPVSASDDSGDMIWTDDFSPDWYRSFMFGNGVAFNYNRQDGSAVNIDLTGKSVQKYYEDMSAHLYTVTGDIVGWIKLDHSMFRYGADPCPGARSASGFSVPAAGGIPAAEGGSPFSDLISDALAKIKTSRPTFNWKQYDQDGDGFIDRLWIVHAGLGEEESPVLLNRTLIPDAYVGEGSIWSHAGNLPSPYIVDPINNIKAQKYIIMPENGGVAVFAHEFAHDLGAMDLYTGGEGHASPGFWTIMADPWTGYPINSEPSAFDPMHLDQWGWLSPTVISDPSQSYEVTLGQASNFPEGVGAVRGIRVDLPDYAEPLPGGGSASFDHKYYLQWRNTAADGGYDHSLADARWLAGPASSGLLVWYYNGKYHDNEIADHLSDLPSFGPKGRLLLFDAHAEPYRFPISSFPNEISNLTSRSQMRDAPYSLQGSADFTYAGYSFKGRSAVKEFSDALGYYPGIEYTTLDSSSPYFSWITRGWDLSAVVPASVPYSIAQYSGNSQSFSGIVDRLWYSAKASATGFVASSVPSPSSLFGGSGNPQERGGAHGWHVRVMSQSSQTANLRIWNGHYWNSLDVTKSGSGSGSITSVTDTGISCGSVCSALYSPGTIVSLSAAPHLGSYFSGWTGACSGTGACSLTLGDETQVDAAFSSCFALALAASPSRGGMVTFATPANCGSDRYLPGTVVSLSASPLPGFSFSRWIGASGDAKNGSVVMDRDTSVTAEFGQVNIKGTCYSLTLKAKPAKGGSVKASPSPNCGARQFRAGTRLTLKATPSRGYILRKWNRDALGRKKAATLSIHSNTVITASFAKHPGRHPAK